MRILDCDHCVALLRGHLDLRGRIAPTEKLAITAVSVGELTHGAFRSSRVAENLAKVDVLDIVTNYVLGIRAPAERDKEGQAHKTRLTNCIQGMPEKSAPANSRGANMPPGGHH